MIEGEKMNISKTDMKILLKSQQGELDVVSNKKDSDTFLKLAAEEGHHTVVFHGLTQEN